MRDSPTVISLRPADAGEADLVHRLAALDDAPRLSGDVLVAVLDGEPVAALSLEDKRVVADPFRLTADAVALLRLRAEHLAATPSTSRRIRYRFARAASST
jgi:hypothetical protein